MIERGLLREGVRAEELRVPARAQRGDTPRGQGLHRAGGAAGDEVSILERAQDELVCACHGAGHGRDHITLN